MPEVELGGGLIVMRGLSLSPFADIGPGQTNPVGSPPPRMRMDGETRGWTPSPTAWTTHLALASK